VEVKNPQLRDSDKAGEKGNHINPMGGEQPGRLADHAGDTEEDILASSSSICRCIEHYPFRQDHEMAGGSINYDDMEIFVAID